MQVWAAASHLPPATFRKVVVGPGLTAEGAVSLQAMARTLADPGDPAAVAEAGAQFAAALLTAGRSGIAYGLSYAQDKALYADVNGLVPDRATPDRDGPAPPAGAAAVAAGTAVASAEASAPLVLPGAEIIPVLSGLGTAVLVGFTVLLWPRPAGEKPGTLPGDLLPPGTRPGGGAASPPPLPQDSGLVPPPPVAKPGEGGLAPPAPDKPADDGTPSPVLPPVQPGPAADTPQMPSAVTMARPSVTPAERKKQAEIIRSKGLPTGGGYPYVPPRTWTSSQPLPRGEKGGYLDDKGREWVKPRGVRQGNEWHWDVQLPDGRHRNVTSKGDRSWEAMIPARVLTMMTTLMNSKPGWKQRRSPMTKP